MERASVPLFPKPNPWDTTTLKMTLCLPLSEGSDYVRGREKNCLHVIIAPNHQALNSVFSAWPHPL